MNKRQENTLTMFLGFGKFIEANQDMTSLLPYFSDLYVDFKNAVTSIRSLRIIQQGDKTGATDEKSNLRKQVEVETYQISKQLVALASLKNYDALLKEASYLPSDLAKVQDTVISDIAALLIKHATTHLAELGPFGTQEKLDALTATLALYDGSITKPKDSITARAQATRQIEELFELANEKLELMTKIVNAVSDKYPDFHRAFMDKTKVVSLGSKGMSLRANAVDLEGKPLPNVQVEIVPQQPTANARIEAAPSQKPNPVAIKKTSTKGIFRIQNLADGSYTAIVRKLGFKEQLVDFHVVKGELVNLNFTLEQA